MRILVISDTHRKDENVEKILKKEGSFDRVFHLGDVEGSQKKLIRMAKCPVDMVAGNNDILGDLPKEKELELCGHHILLTHGHYYYVSLDTGMLGSDAGARGCSVWPYAQTEDRRTKWCHSGESWKCGLPKTGRQKTKLYYYAPGREWGH